MKPRLGQHQGAVFLAHFIPFPIHRTECEWGFSVLELGCVEIILGFEIRRQQTMSTSGRRGRRAEDIAGEDKNGEDEGEDDPYAVGNPEAAPA